MELADLATGLRADGARSLLIDGRSGSGKSTIATALAASWPEAAVIRLDSIYPGWGGLAWASEHLLTSVLEPRAFGLPASWREWDWVSGTAGDWHPVDADRPLIIEGVGCLTVANRALADAAIWVEHDTAERKARALARDGETYVPHWDEWAAQEDVFIAQNRPEALADLIAVPTDGGFDLMQTGRTP